MEKTRITWSRQQRVPAVAILACGSCTWSQFNWNRAVAWDFPLWLSMKPNQARNNTGGYPTDDGFVCIPSYLITRQSETFRGQKIDRRPCLTHTGDHD